MKKLLLLFLSVVLCSCVQSEEAPSETEQYDFGKEDYVTDASGVQYPFLDQSVLSYCGPGWGRKFCHFLEKYEGTVWADTDNYYSDFSDIKFTNFTTNQYFISFFNLDTTTSYCEGWKLGETTYEGITWNIKIKKDQWDALWFDYEYYGTGDEIEYTATYKYEVSDGLLHFTSSDGQTFIFHPSEKNYAEDAVDTGEIIRLEGCLFF